MKLKIKELREEFGLTQRKLAERIDNVQRNVSNWEKGVSEPDCETIIKLADVFNTSIDELFGRQEHYSVELGNAEAMLNLLRRLDEEQLTTLKDFIISMTKKRAD